MEDKREQQTDPPPQPASYAPHLQPGTPAQPTLSSAPAAYPVGTVERMSRLILRRVAYGLILAGRAARPRLGWILLTLLLVGIIGIETVALVAPFFITRMSDNRPPAIPTSAAVESFLNGQTRYDADMMWEAFSPRFQAALIDQGTSREQFVARVQGERAGGKRYTDFAYVGGLALQNDQKMYFYAVDVQLTQTNQSGTVSFVFTVDESGKIVDIQ